MVNALHQLPEYENARVVYHTDTDVVAKAIAQEIDPAKPLGIDEVMRSGFLMPLIERHAASEFFLGSSAVTAARAIKDEEEPKPDAYLFRRKRRCDSRCHPACARRCNGAPRMRTIRCSSSIATAGCNAFSFPPIVSFGANAGDPHHEPDGTVLKRGDVVLFDIGGRYRNYCSDMTRTFFWGEPDEETAHIYDVVRRANEAAEALIAPGVRFCDLDRAARDVIEQAGYGEYLTHRLGSLDWSARPRAGRRLACQYRYGAARHDVFHRAGHLSSRPHRRAHRNLQPFVTEHGVEILNSYSHAPITLRDG